MQVLIMNMILKKENNDFSATVFYETVANLFSYFSYSGYFCSFEHSLSVIFYCDTPFTEIIIPSLKE